MPSPRRDSRRRPAPMRAWRAIAPRRRAPTSWRDWRHHRPASPGAPRSCRRSWNAARRRECRRREARRPYWRWRPARRPRAWLASNDAAARSGSVPLGSFHGDLYLFAGAIAVVPGPPELDGPALGGNGVEGDERIGGDGGKQAGGKDFLAVPGGDKVGDDIARNRRARTGVAGVGRPLPRQQGSDIRGDAAAC